MAGLGYKDFTAGAVLTAAQVDGYLMEQAVMNFAGTAARGSALASVQAAGMVAHVGGGTITVATSGSAWAEIYPGTSPGLVKITDSTFSAGSAVSVNGCFTSTYDNYRILISALFSTDESLRARLRLAGTDATGGTYTYQRVIGSTTTVSTVGGSTETSFYLGDSSTTVSAWSLDIFNPARAAATQHATLNFRTDRTCQTIVGSHTTATAYDGITFFPASGTMTGTIRIYGYRN